MVNGFDLDTFVATPAIWTPDDPDRWEQECADMFVRSEATRLWLQGDLTSDEFADALYDYGRNPNQCFEAWANLESFL